MNSMTYRIRRASSEEALELAEAQALSWRETYRGILPAPILERMTAERLLGQWRGHLRRQTSDHDELCVVAEYDDEIVGFGACGRARDLRAAYEGEVTMIYVRAPQQGIGLGRAMMRGMAQHLVRRGLFSMGLWVVRNNVRARAFYEALHGKCEGAREERMQGAAIPVVGYLWKDLANFVQPVDTEINDTPD